MNARQPIVLAIACLFGLTGAAQAAVVSYNFAGTISTLISDDSSNTFSANFHAGDAVTGSFSFDTAATGQIAAPTLLQWYPASFTATINGHLFSGAAQYRIFNDHPGGDDGFSIINETGTYTGPSLGPLVPSTFFLQWLGMPTSTLGSYNLVADPTALIPLANLAYAPHGFRLDNPDGSFGGAYFSIDKVTPAVPEPGTWALMLLGGAAVVAATRRRRS